MADIENLLYRLMTYFCHSTMVIYESDIICECNMSIPDFRDKNKDVIKRVFDEGLSIMNYEISHNQMDRAILTYLHVKYKPQSTKNTKPYQYKNGGNINIQENQKP